MTADQGAAPPAAATADKLRDEGLRAFQQGAFEEALALFERWAAAEPASPAALYYLGTALNAVGEWEQALARLDRSIEIEPRAHVCFIQKALALLWLQRPTEALSVVEKALALRPADAEAVVARTRILLAMGAPAEAEQAIATALRAAPNDVEVRATAADVLATLDRKADAEDLYASVRALASGYGDRVADRALLLAERGRHTAALDLADRALAVVPGHFVALDAAAFSLASLNKFEEAVPILQAVVSQRPDSAVAWSNLGFALFKQARLPEAQVALARSTTLDPSLSVAQEHHANVLNCLGRHAEAAEAFDRAAALSPGRAVLKAGARMNRAYACCWRDREADLAEAAGAVEAGEMAVSAFGSLALFDDPILQRRCAELEVAVAAQRSRPHRARARRAQGKIRLCYVSADFRQHPVGKLMADVLERHDRSRFELIGFATDLRPEDALRRRLRGTFDEFHEIRHMPDAAMADLIEDRNIEIAVSLSGLADEGRVAAFARKPAPIQVNFLGFSGTLGAPFVDYIVGDPIVTPPGSEARFAESIVRLPSCFFPNGPRNPGKPPARSECDLPDHAIVFCAFANGFKITPRVFSSWMRILQDCPGSVLWLLDRAGVADNLRREAQARGVDPERLVFAGHATTEEDYLARLSLADIMLDTAPYGAHTTASDALWLGVPVVTSRGETFASRVGASLVAAVGLPELDRGGEDDYEAYAIALAHDPERRAALKARLLAARATSSLFDPARVTRDLEAAFAEMSARSRRGEAPASFDVPASHG